MPDAPSPWPLFDLRVSAPRLTLRLPSDTELMELARRAAGRVLPAEQAGFLPQRLVTAALAGVRAQLHAVPPVGARELDPGEVLRRERWEAHRRSGISVSGLAGCLELFGL